MDTLNQNISQSEQTVVFLREQISILTALAAKKRQNEEAGEIKRLLAENEQLAKELTQLKENLQYYEVQKILLQKRDVLTHINKNNYFQAKYMTIK